MRCISLSLLAWVAVSTAACTPLQLGLTAVSMLSGSGGDQTVAASSPRADLMSALAGLDSTISPACQAMVDATAKEQPATSSALPEQATESCRLQLVCLPGAASPVEMMACTVPPGETEAGETTTVAAEAQDSAWPWQGSQEQTDVDIDE